MKKIKKAKGAARMKELGSIQVSLWLDPAEAIAIRKAAKLAGLPVATYCRRVAFLVACDSRWVTDAYRMRFNGGATQVHKDSLQKP